MQKMIIYVLLLFMPAVSPVSCQSLHWLTDQLHLAAVYVALQLTWNMTNTNVVLDFALSPANFARDSVRTQTISTAWKTALFISAGRNTHVTCSALPTASAKSKLRHNQSRRRSLESTKHSSTQSTLKWLKD
jgi:hypothetical protein